MILEMLFVSLVGIEKFDIKLARLKEITNEEVAVEASVVLDIPFSASKFSACIPQESIPFKGAIPPQWEPSIFEAKAMSDLAECNSNDCAFNFLPSEVHALGLLETDAQRRDFYQRALKDRTQFKLGIDPYRRPHFITSRDQAFSSCGEGKVMEDLLNNRPLRDLPFRMSHVKYNRNMRPTTRLSQGVFWTPKKPPSDQICYAEALIFSDHYDIDRVEVWSLEGQSLRFQLRTRIDLLNTWLRRLNKEKFRKEAESIVERQLQGAIQCFKMKK